MDAERTAGRAVLPFGLIGMIALVALVEARLGRSGRFESDMAVSWRIKSAAVAREAAKSDVLCFGDSQVEFGVLAPVLEERLGAKVYNLALHAGTPSASYFLLKRALDAGAKPRAIVVDFSTFQVVQNPTHELNRRRAWPELATLRDAVDLWRNLEDGDLFGSIVLGRAFPSVKARPEIRAAVAADLAGKVRTADEMLFVPSERRNLEINRGTLVMPKSLRGPDPAPFNPDITTPLYDPHRLAYADRFLRLAAGRGIPVYWVLMPISPEYQRASEATGADSVYSELVRRFSDRFPNVVVVDGRRVPGFDASRFMDAIHLSGEGAQALTNGLADVMQEAGSARPSRHVALPPYHERSTRRRLENQVESRDYLAAAIARMYAPTAVR